MSTERALEGEGRGFYRRRARTGRTWPRSWAALALAAGATASCQTVAITGRSQLNRFSVEEDKALGAQAYEEVLKGVKLADSGPDAAMVQRVVQRLAAVADDPGFEWEAHVIDDPKTVNAWCMPGGKIAVYTGILPVTKDETGLAVVLGHEIAHAIARHGTERMTTQELTGVGLSLAEQRWGSVAEYRELIATAANLFVFMPWGRNHELEADHIGLIYMARAGYDPREAVTFWQRMAANGGEKPPEWLSTHPSDEHRIEEIEKLLPRAMRAYEKARGGG
jgi:predicted Zn-dependent protease